MNTSVNLKISGSGTNEEFGFLYRSQLYDSHSLWGKVKDLRGLKHLINTGQEFPIPNTNYSARMWKEAYRLGNGGYDNIDYLKQNYNYINMREGDYNYLKKRALEYRPLLRYLTGKEVNLIIINGEIKLIKRDDWLRGGYFYSEEKGKCKIRLVSKNINK